MKLSILIPAYNEQNTILEILQKVVDVSFKDVSREIIIVDDGSKDNTLKIAKEFAQEKPFIKIIEHGKNRGKGAAVVTAIKHASGDIMIIQDADLEYDPQDIPKLIDPIVKKKYRVVYGTRLRTSPVFFGKNRTPLLAHFFGNKFLSFLTTVIYGSQISDMETCYKAFETNVLKGIKLRSRSFDLEPEITAKILKKHIKIHEVDIKTKPRGYADGKKLHTVRDGTIALWTLIKYRFTN